MESIHEFSSAVCDYLGRSSTPVFGSQRVFIIDGTTITLQPTPQLKRALPPATNQHGESVLPVAMLMVAHEMQSGCALLPQIDPMYGPKRTSEAEQARRIVKRLPGNSIVMADAGLGIFSVAYHSTQAKHDILFRLTKPRFTAMCRNATLIDQSKYNKSYSLFWRPSEKDRKSNPNLPEDASIEVAINEIELDNKTIMSSPSEFQRRLAIISRSPAVTGASQPIGVARTLCQRTDQRRKPKAS